MRTIDAPTLRLILPQLGPQLAANIAAALPAALGEAAIDKPARAAAFIAQVAWESISFTRLVEDLYYRSTARLRQVWPTRFPTNESAVPFLGQPQKLACYVYGGRLGNAPAPSLDGWTYRGRGWLQHTGKEAAHALQDALGLPLLAHPELLELHENAARAAAWYWRTKHINLIADVGDFRGVTIAVNGGLTDHTEREKIYKRALPILAA